MDRARLLSGLQFYFTGALNSYAQVFFSRNKVFAAIILLVTFMHPLAGCSALIMVLLTQLLFVLLGFDRQGVGEGLYGLNSLLVGLGVSSFYDFNLQFVSLLVLASILSCFVTIWLVKRLGRQQLPFLSMPFLITMWILLLAVRDYSFLSLNERGVFEANELYSVGGMWMVGLFEQLEDPGLPVFLVVYLKSLGAIFFQTNLLAGALIALGLIFYSRIAFVLSLIGFVSGYAYCAFMGDNFNEIYYSHIGFNFILSAVALSGFFIIPNRSGVLFCLLITPLIAVVNSAFVSLFGYVQLPIYSLPFNAIVLLVLYVMQARPEERHLILTKVQYASPERNLYSHVNFTRRFPGKLGISLQLPFYGVWRISQGHNGAYTHQQRWRHAWDFDILDGDGLTYRSTGRMADHYHCYEKTVLVPADGEVVSVIDGIEDNAIGTINQQQNWGNSVVIKHGKELYSQLSHLKTGSITVKAGDHVRQGTALATLGNSGRSPYPHLHFQVQPSPYVGSETMAYPVANYIRETEEGPEFVDAGIPTENECIANVSVDEVLNSAFALIPGRTLRWTIKENGHTGQACWTVKTNMVTNQNYIHCPRTGSYAYFRQDPALIRFTDYIGPKHSLLYFFYLGVNKVVLGAYENLTLKDRVPVHQFVRGPWKLVQDLLAPVVMFHRVEFHSKCTPKRENFRLKSALLQSQVTGWLGNWMIRQYRFEMEVNEDGITRFTVETPTRNITAACTDC